MQPSGGFSPHQVERMLAAGIRRGLTDAEVGRINATLDCWQETIKSSDKRKVVDKYHRLLNAALWRLEVVEVNQVLLRGMRRGLTDEQSDAVNAALDKWQQTIKSSEEPEQVEYLHDLVLHTIFSMDLINILFGDECDGKESRVSLLMRHLDCASAYGVDHFYEEDLSHLLQMAAARDVGLPITDLNDIVLAYAQEQEDDANDTFDDEDDYNWAIPASCGCCRP